MSVVCGRGNTASTAVLIHVGGRLAAVNKAAKAALSNQVMMIMHYFCAVLCTSESKQSARKKEEKTGMQWMPFYDERRTRSRRDEMTSSQTCYLVVRRGAAAASLVDTLCSQGSEDLIHQTCQREQKQSKIMNGESGTILHVLHGRSTLPVVAACWCETSMTK